jgi:hypothetical protein
MSVSQATAGTSRRSSAAPVGPVPAAPYSGPTGGRHRAVRWGVGPRGRHGAKKAVLSFGPEKMTEVTRRSAPAATEHRPAGRTKGRPVTPPARCPARPNRSPRSCHATVGCAVPRGGYNGGVDARIDTGRIPRCHTPSPSPYASNFGTATVRAIRRRPWRRLTACRRGPCGPCAADFAWVARGRSAGLPRAAGSAARQAGRVSSRSDPAAPRTPDLGGRLAAHHSAAALPRQRLAVAPYGSAVAEGRRPETRPARPPAGREREPGDSAARGLADGRGRVHPPGQR